MTVDQWLLLGFAVAVFLAAVLLFVFVPARIRRTRERLRDVEPDVRQARSAGAMPQDGRKDGRKDGHKDGGKDAGEGGPGAAGALPPLAIAAADGPPDDLQQMKGVGPRLAALLNGLGITRFSQIAAMSPAELAALDARLGSFRGRPERDRWQEQARLLAAGDRKGFERLHGKLGPEA